MFRVTAVAAIVETSAAESSRGVAPNVAPPSISNGIRTTVPVHERITLSGGFGYDGRRGVGAREVTTPLDAGGNPSGPGSAQETLADGRQDELGAHAVVRWCSFCGLIVISAAFFMVLHFHCNKIHCKRMKRLRQQPEN